MYILDKIHIFFSVDSWSGLSCVLLIMSYFLNRIALPPRLVERKLFGQSYRSCNIRSETPDA